MTLAGALINSATVGEARAALAEYKTAITNRTSGLPDGLGSFGYTLASVADTLLVSYSLDANGGIGG